MIDIRDAFFDAFYEIGASDRNVVFLTDDMDAFSLRKFKEDFPDQFVNIGVAEQNMINLATGLATCGKRVFAFGISSFVTLRCFEQIKVNMCSMNLPVTLIGIGAGFSFAFDGPTHHGTQDVAIMRALPEITIYNLSDINLASACAGLAYRSDGPVYVRLDKGGFPELGDKGDDFSRGFRILKPLQEMNIVSTGFMTLEALTIAKELDQKGLQVGVVDVYRLKPIGDEFVEQVIDPSREIITLEENSIVSGLGSIVAELVADRQTQVQLRRFGVQDEQFICYGSREWLLDKNGLNTNDIIKQLSEKVMV